MDPQGARDLTTCKRGRKKKRRALSNYNFPIATGLVCENKTTAAERETREQSIFLEKFLAPVDETRRIRPAGMFWNVFCCRPRAHPEGFLNPIPPVRDHSNVRPPRANPESVRRVRQGRSDRCTQNIGSADVCVRTYRKTFPPSLLSYPPARLRSAQRNRRLQFLGLRDCHYEQKIA